MRICGIVCEYNPFHTGHRAQFDAIRARLGCDCAVVCCMSGNFVQRGEAALAPKHLRAESALRSGADLVLELPLPWALSSAEGFAHAAVSILGASGVVTDLAFGAEDAELSRLWPLADAALEKSTVDATLEHLESGIPYARARERALHAVLHGEADLLQRPNNILAIEYLKALRRLQSPIQPLALPRTGAGHDGEPAGGFASATWLRARLRAGEWEKARPYLPDSSFELLQQAAQQGGLLLSPERLECALLPVLLRMDIGELAALPGASEGLEHRLYDAIRRSRGFDELWQTAKTKRYPASRLRRMLLCAYLGVTAADQAQPVPYIRVLGISQAGRALLRDMAEKSALPVVTRPAQIKLLSAPARALFDREVLADDLYRFALPCWRQERVGDSWRRQAVIL